MHQESVELHFTTSDDSVVLERWVLKAQGREISADRNGRRQYLWSRPGPRILALALVRLANWQPLENNPLPELIPVLEAPGRPSAAASLGDALGSASRVSWIAAMLGMDSPEDDQGAVRRLRNWFEFENPQAQKKSERVSVSINSSNLPPEAVSITLNGNPLKDGELDWLDRRISGGLDSGLPPRLSAGKITLVGNLSLAVSLCRNRNRELTEIDRIYNNPFVRLLILRGKSGSGKTTVAQEWLGRSCMNGAINQTLVFAWSFYLQGFRGGSQTLGDFWRDLAFFLGVEIDDATPPLELANTILEKMREKSPLLLLDGFEVMQDATSNFAFGIKDQALSALIEAIVLEEFRGWVLITSRRSLSGSPEVLQPKVQHMGLETWDAPKTSNTQTLSPLAWRLAHSVNKEASVEPGQLKPIVRTFVGHCTALERSILVGTCFYDRPIQWDQLCAFMDSGNPVVTLSAEITEPSEEDWEEALGALHSKGILNRSHDGHIGLHPRVAELLAEEVRSSNPKAWSEGHQWLSDWFSNNGCKQHPDTLEEMEPLFRATWHSCQAGCHKFAFEELVYRRLCRGNANYVVNENGNCQLALNIILLFSEDLNTFPAGTDLTLEDRAILLHGGADCLNRLGRQQEFYSCQRTAWERIRSSPCPQTKVPIAVHMLLGQYMFGDLRESAGILKQLFGLMIRSSLSSEQLRVEQHVMIQALGYIGSIAAMVLSAKGSYKQCGLLLKAMEIQLSKLAGGRVLIAPGFGAVWHALVQLELGKWKQVEKGLEKEGLQSLIKYHQLMRAEDLVRGRMLSIKADQVKSPTEAASLRAEATTILADGLSHAEAMNDPWWTANFRLSLSRNLTSQGEKAEALKETTTCVEEAGGYGFQLIELDAELLLCRLRGTQPTPQIVTRLERCGYRHALQRDGWSKNRQRSHRKAREDE